MKKHMAAMLALAAAIASAPALAQKRIQTQPMADEDAPPASGETAAAGAEVQSEVTMTTETRRVLESNRYLGLMATYFQPDENRAPDVDYGNGISFLYGSQSDSGLGFELQLAADFFETGENRGTDFYRQGLGLDLFWALGDRTAFTPFLLIGGGYGYNDVHPDERDDWDWNANAGIGFVSGPWVFDLFRLRGEVRYIYDNFEETSEDYRAGLGLEFPIYRRITTVTETGEEKVRVVEVHSGLSDADGDGVIDSRDRCPGTPPATRVDGEGCTLPKVLTLKGVNFEFNSSDLRPDSRKILADVYDILRRYPDMRVEIAGHTDSVGSDSYNERLSQSRAQSVYVYLGELGMPATQARVAGYGESQPVASNDTDDGRELNRRVEMRILN